MFYIVVRSGVYDQGVVGIADTATKAQQIAEAAAVEEHDTYHDFVVRIRDDQGWYTKDVMIFGAPWTIKENSHRRWTTCA